ncbi:MAG TPA: TetR/AcrR family transcriptional regulator, partial [Methylocella sp.]|nr:TetR/AcrR family transcriptional regulator [Methylocella sp.]
MSTSKIKAPAAPYHHGDLRRVLLAAGFSLLEKRGPAQVSLREVARVAGVSHTAPYRHFDSREALLAALAADGFEALDAAMERAAEGRAGFERLHALGVAYIAFARAQPAVYLLMFGPELEKDPFPALKTVAERSYEALRQAIDAIAPEETRRAAAIGA